MGVSEYAPYLFTADGQVTGQVAEVARHVFVARRFLRPGPRVTALVVPAGNPRELATLDDVRSGRSADLETTPGFVPPDRPYLISAFAFRRQDTEVRAEVDQALIELHESEEWLHLSEPFGFDGSNLPSPVPTVDKACSGG